jgi:uncharacterized beta-barrel protein YwiB (DUF1934 family)
MGAIKGTPILISLDSVTSTDEQPEETMRMITTGELIEKADETLIRFEETIDESEAPQKIEIAVSGNVITMRRRGVYDVDMVFQKGQRYESQYRMPFGVMDMALYCVKAAYTREGDGGEVALRYQLDLSGQYAAMHDLRLHFMRKKEA